MSDAIAREFAFPGSAWRGKPFWAWNGKLEPEELRRQIRVMRRMGMGGFFMHARVGLATPYLSHALVRVRQRLRGRGEKAEDGGLALR